MFNRFTNKDSYTRNITHNTESTGLKLEARSVGITVGSRGKVPEREDL